MIRLPLPPSLNKLYHTTRRGGFYKSNEAKSYNTWTKMSLLRKVDILEGDVSLRIKFYFPTKAGDIDSKLKVLLDALSGCLYYDDRQIVHLDLYKFKDKDDPHLEIEVL